MTWVRTKDLSELIPNISCCELERETGIDSKRWWVVKVKRSEYTDFYVADRMLTSIGRPDLLASLEVFEKRPVNKHGLTAYNHYGCRCKVCKEAKYQHDYKQRFIRAKLKTV